MKTMIKVKHEHNRDIQACFRCGDTGHYSKDCPELNTSKDTLRLAQGNGEKIRCYKCGHFGHEQSQCIKRNVLDDDIYAKSIKNPKVPFVETKKKAPTYDDNGNEIKIKDLIIQHERPANNFDPDKFKNIECYNCHKLGHFRNECPFPDQKEERNPERPRFGMPNPFQPPSKDIIAGSKRMSGVGFQREFISESQDANKRARLD